MLAEGPHLYDPSAQPRHLCQFLQRLSVRVVVLRKLRLHDLHRHTYGSNNAHPQDKVQQAREGQGRLYLQLLGSERCPCPLGRLWLTVLVRGKSAFQGQPSAFQQTHIHLKTQFTQDFIFVGVIKYYY